MLGSEQSIVVDDGGDGKFDANDAIEFYGYPLDTLSTGARTYWLRAGKGTSNRVAVSKVNGGDPITGSVPFTYERIMRGIFASIVNNDDADAFFGALITIDPVTEPLTVANLDTSYGGNATLELVIQGGTDMAHRIDVAFNGHSLGTVTLWRRRAAVVHLHRSAIVADERHEQRHAHVAERLRRRQRPARKRV